MIASTRNTEAVKGGVLSQMEVVLKEKKSSSHYCALLSCLLVHVHTSTI
jgi:hypothetical protein